VFTLRRICEMDAGPSEPATGWRQPRKGKGRQSLRATISARTSDRAFRRLGISGAAQLVEPDPCEASSALIISTARGVVPSCHFCHPARAFCGKRLKLGGATVDHLVPLSKQRRRLGRDALPRQLR
jgi:hypothetical protein